MILFVGTSEFESFLGKEWSLGLVRVGILREESCFEKRELVGLFSIY